MDVEADHRGDQRDQRAAREVEIGDQGIDMFPAVGGINENGGLIGFGGEGGVRGLAFEDAGGGRANGDDATFLAFCDIETSAARRIDRVSLGVHRVGLECIGGDGFEGAETDVEGDERAWNPPSRIRERDSGEKCNAAVGAATAPGDLAKTV